MKTTYILGTNITMGTMKLYRGKYPHNPPKNHSILTVKLSCSEDYIEEIAQNIKKALNSAKIDVWLFAINVGDGMSIEYCGPEPLDFHFAKQIIESQITPIEVTKEYRKD